MIGRSMQIENKGMEEVQAALKEIGAINYEGTRVANKYSITFAYKGRRIRSSVTIPKWQKVSGPQADADKANERAVQGTFWSLCQAIKSLRFCCSGSGMSEAYKHYAKLWDEKDGES